MKSHAAPPYTLHAKRVLTRSVACFWLMGRTPTQCGFQMAHSSSNALGSALFVACAGGEAECAATLLGYGATVDLETSDGMTGLLFASQMVALPSWYWRPWAGTWTACKDCSCEVHRPKLSKLPRICQARIEMTVLMRMTTTKMRKMQCP